METVGMVMQMGFQTVVFMVILLWFIQPSLQRIAKAIEDGNKLKRQELESKKVTEVE